MKAGQTMIYDYLIIGAGISGAAAAYELRTHGTVAVIEAEGSAGYHSTGRSAALFTGNYGDPIVQLINQASSAFFQNPPIDFCDTPLLTPRGQLTVAMPGDIEKLTPILQQSTPAAPINMLSAAEACELAPLLNPEHVEAAAFEAGVADIEVANLHQAYLRAAKQNSANIISSMRINNIIRKDGTWHVSGNNQTIIGKTIINAAGAWADQVALMAGARAAELVAKRRTVIIIDPPEGINIANLPAIDFADNNSYIKPEAGKLMASPGDETPIEPQDVQPEELDIAVLVDWLERRTLIKMRRVNHSWAGLRTFASDNLPIVGYDPLIENFFWLAGQGGYGIMMAPALGQATASLITCGTMPDNLLSMGMKEANISPRRLYSSKSIANQ